MSGVGYFGSAHVAAASVFADDFNRADGAIGGNWTVEAGTWQISSNGLTTTGSSADEWVKFGSSVGSDDMYVEADIDGVLGAFPGITLRNHPTQKTFYMLVYNPEPSNGDRVLITKFINGVETNVVFTSRGTFPSPPYRLRLEASGANLEAFVDGVSVLTATDSSISGHSQGGLRTFSSTANNTYDNFEVGAL